MRREVVPLIRSDDELCLVAEMQSPIQEIELHFDWQQLLAGGALLGMIVAVSYLFWMRASQ
jgi:hypothetical protein